MTNQHISAVKVAMKECEPVLILTKHGGILVGKILQQSLHLLLPHLLQLDQGVEPGDDHIDVREGLCSQMRRPVELGESLLAPLGQLLVGRHHLQQNQVVLCRQTYLWASS